MKQKLGKLVLAVLVLFALCAFTLPTGVAHASSGSGLTSQRSQNTPQRGGYGYQYITHQCLCGFLEQALHTIRLSPGTGGSITQTYGTSNTWGASFGASYSAVQGGLNFSITQSYSLSASCSLTNNTNHDRYLTFYAYFNTWDFDVYWHNSITGQNTYQGYGWAEDYQYDYCYATP